MSHLIAAFTTGVLVGGSVVWALAIMAIGRYRRAVDSAGDPS